MDVEKCCFNCKFCDGFCCMYNYAVYAILEDVETAKDCNHYKYGEYNQDALEKSNYR